MISISTPASQSLVSIKNGKAATTSNVVAETFGKKHNLVLRAIRNLECSKEFSECNFALIQNDVDLGFGRTRQDPAYAISKDGFMFLAMGFTGKEAAKWKEQFIAAFNAMEAELLRTSTKSKPQAIANQTISPAQQRELQEAVSKKALSAPIGAQRTSFKTLWGSIKSHFHVGTYKDLSESQFNSAVEFVENFHWELLDAAKVPTSQTPQKRYEFPKEMLFQDYFCGKNEDGSLTLPKLDLHTFANNNFDSAMAKLLTAMHDDGHNVDAPYAEFMAMRFGIKRVSDQLGALFSIGADSGNATLKIICRK